MPDVLKMCHAEGRFDGFPHLPPVTCSSIKGHLSMHSCVMDTSHVGPEGIHKVYWGETGIINAIDPKTKQEDPERIPAVQAKQTHAPSGLDSIAQALNQIQIEALKKAGADVTAKIDAAIAQLEAKKVDAA